MSKVRIYELAKEAGLSSKILIEKLQEHGYDIKGPSASVEEDIAEKIRTTVLQSSKAELAKKKIASEEEPVVVRRTTVIRRRPAPVPEVQAEPEAPVVQEAAPVEEAIVPAPDQQQPVEESQEAPVDKGAQEAGARETTAPVLVDFKKQDSELDRELKVVPGTDEKETVAPEEQETASRKGLARVVGSIEMPVEEKKQVEEKPRKRVERPAERPAGAGGYRPQAPASKPPVAAASPGDASKGKKKGKRGGETDDTEQKKAGAWKADKFGQKGRGKVQVTRFGDEYSSMGKRGKRSRGRVERKVIQPAVEMKAIKKRIKVMETISVADLAHRMGVKSSEIIAKLMSFGVMATLNQALDVDTATLIGHRFRL